MNPKSFPFLLNNLEKEAEMNIDSLSVTYEAYMYMHIHMHLCVCVCVSHHTVAFWEKVCIIISITETKQLRLREAK